MKEFRFSYFTLNNIVTIDEYALVFNTASHLGVIRDIDWEGLGDSQVKFFTDNYGLNIDKDVILVEITNEKHNDAWALYAMLVVLGILGIVFIIAAVKQKRK